MKQKKLPENLLDLGLGIDTKRLLFRIIRFWYIIVLSVLLFQSIAYVKNRYSVRIYPTSASLIVKEAEEISGGELLYNNPLVNFRRNYLNELYILKSYPLIQDVVEDLNFDVSVYRQGSILKTEAYKDLPFEIYTDRSRSIKSHTFILKILSDTEFSLEDGKEEKTFESKKFRFSDSISIGEYKGFIRISDKKQLNSAINEPLIFVYTPSIIVAESYVNSLKAEWAEEGAGIINLSINGPNQRKSKDFLSGLIARYQDNDLENKNLTASRTVDFITDQLVGIGDSLTKVENQLEQFRDKNVVTDLNGEALRLYQNLEVLDLQKVQLSVSKSYYEYLIDYIQKDQNMDQIILPSSVGINDPILTNLISKMNEAQYGVRMSTKIENPSVQEAIKGVQQLKKDVIESVRNQESADNIRLQFLNRQINEIEKVLNSLPATQRNLVSIQRNYTLLENLHIFLLQKRSEAAISKASNTSDILIVNPPKSGAAIYPKSRVNYIIALVVGLCLPLFVFSLIEFFDNRIQSREDIEKLTSIPFIGGVGHKKDNSNNLEVFTHPKTVIAESFRALRSNLNFFLNKKDKAVFMITSSISGEGKTFTSINLASVLALSGKKTLIVGADMRRPKLYDDFGLSNDLGLSTYLAGLSTIEQVIQHTNFENLDLVSGGPVPPNPSELLLTSRMDDFLKDAKLLYDFIIIDTPPLAIVTDAFVLSPYADHTLFLVRQDYTPKDLLKTAQDFFSSGKLTNVSIVFNDIYRSGPGYGYGYNYNYGYGYGYGYVYRGKKSEGQSYYEG